MRTVLITSFKRFHEDTTLEVPGYSAAVYQPKWIPKLPKLGCFDIRGDDGKWIRPREFLDWDDPLYGYTQALEQLYDSRRFAIEATLDRLDFTSAMCCWCPYDQAAQRQIEEWGTYVCHTAVMGRILGDWFGCNVFYDRDRDRMVKL